MSFSKICEKINKDFQEQADSLEFCVRMLDQKCMELSRQVANCLRASDTDTAKDLAEYQMQLAAHRINVQKIATDVRQTRIQGV